MDEAGGTDKGLSLSDALSTTFWGRVEEVVGWVSKSDATTSHTARLGSRQGLASVQAQRAMEEG